MITDKENKSVRAPLTPPIPGIFRNLPSSGTRLKKFTATGKNPLHRRRNTKWLNEFTNGWSTNESILPEQQKESIGFNDHSNNWPSQQDNNDAAEERYRCLDLSSLEKETERSLQSNHTRQTTNEQNL